MKIFNKLIILLTASLLIFSVACDDSGDNNDTDITAGNTASKVTIMPEDTPPVIIFNSIETQSSSWETGVVIPVPEGAVAGLFTAQTIEDNGITVPVYIGHSTTDALYYEFQTPASGSPDFFGFYPSGQTIFIHSIKDAKLRAWISLQYAAANGINHNTLYISITPRIWYFE